MKTIYNPTTKDFKVKYDINEDGKPVTYSIKAMEMAEFSNVVADHITKHLATHILNKRGIKENPELDLERITEEIEVEI